MREEGERGVNARGTGKLNFHPVRSGKVFNARIIGYDIQVGKQRYRDLIKDYRKAIINVPALYRFRSKTPETQRNVLIREEEGGATASGEKRRLQQCARVFM